MNRPLRIVTLNTWKCEGRYRDRLGWMADGLAALSPDVVCLQEAFVCESADADTARRLAESLNVEAYVLSLRRKLRDFEGAARESFSNLAILSCWPGIQSPPIKLTECARDRDRWAMALTISPSDAPAITLINTHLTHVRGEEGSRIRYEQAREIARLCGGAEGATVLCGDFNDPWEADSLAPLAALDWTAAETEIEGGTFQGEAARTDTPPRRIDQVQLLDPQGLWRLIARRPCLNQPVGPNGEFPSDHAALAADIELKETRI